MRGIVTPRGRACQRPNRSLRSAHHATVGLRYGRGRERPRAVRHPRQRRRARGRAARRRRTPDLVLVGGDAVPGAFAAPRSTGSRSCPRAGCAATGSARSRPRSTAPSPPRTTSAAVTASSARDELGAERAAAARRAPADARDRRRPVLPRHAARDEEILTRLSTPTSATPRRSPASRGRSSSPATRTSSTTAPSARIRFLNAGSVGLPYEGDGAARWLWVADGVPELRSTAYDARAAGRRMLRRWPDVRSIDAALIEPGPGAGDHGVLRAARSSSDLGATWAYASSIAPAISFQSSPRFRCTPIQPRCPTYGGRK